MAGDTVKLPGGVVHHGPAYLSLSPPDVLISIVYLILSGCPIDPTLLTGLQTGH